MIAGVASVYQNCESMMWIFYKELFFAKWLINDNALFAVGTILVGLHPPKSLRRC